MGAPKTPLLVKGFEQTREELRGDLDIILRLLESGAERYAGVTPEAVRQRRIRDHAGKILSRVLDVYQQEGWMTTDEVLNYRRLISQVQQR